MTQNHDPVIVEYRDADFNRRIHMYLQFPHLRSAFILIDQNDKITDESTGFKLGRNPLAAQLSVLFCSAAGCAKRILGNSSV